MKEKALVICPGRGTYNAAELGTLKRHGQAVRPLIDAIDDARRKAEQPTVSELDDAEKFSPSVHTRGENAAALIFACSLVDFHAINFEQYEIVAIMGNSMGWYTALALGRALERDDAFFVANTMGSMMKGGVIGGQLIYPEVDEQWQPDPKKVALIEHELAAVNQVQGCEAYTSIHFGGYRVMGGNEAGLQALSQRLPKVDERFPMRLVNHAAFHTPLLCATADRALALILPSMFGKPHLPLIDGRGHIWQPYSTKPKDLYQYTLDHQVTHSYDFTQALTVGLKEFAPTKLIVLGPGTTLGGAVGQVLVRHRWQGIISKDAFIKMQKASPYLLAMGHKDQRSRVV